MDKVNFKQLLKKLFIWNLLQVCVWLVVILSAVALLFSIGHNLKGVENWVSLHCWELLLLVKTFSLLLYWKANELKFADIFDKSEHLSQIKITSFIFFLLTMFTVLLVLSGDIISSTRIYSLEGAMSLIAKLSLYLVDIIIIQKIMSALNSSSIAQRLNMSVVLSITTFFTNSLFFNASHSIDGFYFINVTACYLVIFAFNLGLRAGIVFHLAISLPFNLLTVHNGEPYGPWLELDSYILEQEYALVVLLLLGAYSICLKGLLRPVLK